MKKDTNTPPHWDLMLATVKEVATLGDGSLTQLEQEFLEEFGHLPTSDLIDYFTSLQGNKTKNNPPQVTEKKKPDTNEKDVDPEIKFTDQIALESDSTILVYRKTFEKTFGKKPSLELVAHFLKRLAHHRKSSMGKPVHSKPAQSKPAQVKQAQVEIPTKQGRAAFIQNFVAGKTPTILNFRREFEKEFGVPPSPEIIGNFLEMLSRK
jgi:hypothetical protein